MKDARFQSPEAFIETLRQYQSSDENARAALANVLADSVLSNRVNLSQVRQELFQSGQSDLMDTLDGLLEIISPYLQEDGTAE
jgi:hypothetical protein